MPLYPDEIAFRLLRSRYLADGTTAYGLLPCLSNAKQIPVVLRPFAYAASVIDFGLGWSMIRFIQVAGVMLVLLTTLLVTIRRDAPAAALITAAALIGVVGSGLVLSRGETPMLFLGVACVAGYGIVTGNHRGILVSVLYLVVSTCLALFAFFIHQQALILAPILLLIAIAIAMRTRSLMLRLMAGVCFAAVVAGAAASLGGSQISCPEYPAISPVFAKMELAGLARDEGWQGVEAYLLNKLPRYADRFGFNASYDINYLPGIDPALSGTSLTVLNGAIGYAVRLNLILAFGAMAVFVVRCIRVLLLPGAFRDRVAALLQQPSLYVALGIAGHLALLIYDVPTAFYRNFHIHFMLVMLNVIALSAISGKARLLLWPVGIASLTLCLASGSWSSEMDRQFAQGWAGPSIPLQTEWGAIRARVREAAGKCNIGDQDAGVVIDDLTFDAMKRHPHLVPITYIGFALPPNDADRASLSRLLRRISASAIVARCGSVRAWGLTPQYENGEVCCLKLPAGGATP